MRLVSARTSYPWESSVESIEIVLACERPCDVDGGLHHRRQASFFQVQSHFARLHSRDVQQVFD